MFEIYADGSGTGVGGGRGHIHHVLHTVELFFEWSDDALHHCFGVGSGVSGRYPHCRRCYIRKLFDRQLTKSYEAYNNDIALEIVRRYCERSGGIELQTYSSPRSGMQRIREWQPDVVLLDIEMSGTSGIELARQLPTSCCLIFTTAYAQYALEGFEVNAVDFLHKPFFYERFERAMQKARQWVRMHDLLRTSESAVRQLLLKSDYKTISVSIDTILYIESIDNYVKVHLANGTSMLSKIPLHIVEGQLPQGEFIRIHRSFLVARCRIARFSKTEIILEKDGKALPIGRKYMDNLKLLF